VCLPPFLFIGGGEGRDTFGSRLKKKFTPEIFGRFLEMVDGNEAKDASLQGTDGDGPLKERETENGRQNEKSEDVNANGQIQTPKLDNSRTWWETSLFDDSDEDDTVSKDSVLANVPFGLKSLQDGFLNHVKANGGSAQSQQQKIEENQQPVLAVPTSSCSSSSQSNQWLITSTENEGMGIDERVEEKEQEEERDEQRTDEGSDEKHEKERQEDEDEDEKERVETEWKERKREQEEEEEEPLRKKFRPQSQHLLQSNVSFPLPSSSLLSQNQNITSNVQSIFRDEILDSSPSSLSSSSHMDDVFFIKSDVDNYEDPLSSHSSPSFHRNSDADADADEYDMKCPKDDFSSEEEDYSDLTPGSLKCIYLVLKN
jgi:hypothetical protein